MDVRAAVSYEAGKPLVIETVQLDGPRAFEVLVEIRASGVCHTDEFTRSGADPEGLFPAIFGHEGAGVVVDVGPGVASVKKGDHVIPLYTPECRQCKSCLSRRTNLCTAIRATQGKGVMPDGTSRFSIGGRRIHHYMGCSTFANFTVLPEIAVAKIREDAPFDKVCYIGCGVTTGLGAVINTAKVEPGSNVVVFGLGGIGLNVVQGARMVGALHHVQPDTAQAEHDDVGARLDFRGVDHRAQPGGDPASDIADLVERRILADLRDRDLGQDRVVREGGAAHVVVDLLSTDREAAGAVGHHALALRGADRGAQVRLARQARLALPALGRVERNDVVALLHRGDAGPDVDHDACAPVPEDRREEPFRIGARTRELVGMAHATRPDLDQHLESARPVELHGFDRQRLAGFVADCCAHVHRWSPRGTRSRRLSGITVTRCCGATDACATSPHRASWKIVRSSAGREATPRRAQDGGWIP